MMVRACNLINTSIAFSVHIAIRREKDFFIAILGAGAYYKRYGTEGMINMMD